MTACPTDARLAAAASGEDAAAAAHAATCPRCARIVGDHAALVELARALPSPPFSPARRAELAAEVIASAGPSPRRTAMPVIVGIAALAAIVALVISQLGGPRAPVQVATPAPAPAPAPRPIVTPLRPEPAPAPAPHEPTAVAHADASHVNQVLEAVVRIPETVSQLVVTTGVIAAHQRFAPAKSRAATTIERDEWQPTPDPTGLSLAAFRDGWEALHAGHAVEARAAFDRAVDPVVAEDASYWGAIAAERAGEHADAQRRLHAFLDRFPQSARADDARAALDPQPRP